MSALIIFLLFFLFIALAIPIAVSLGIVSVLPGMTDPSFTATASFVIRSMVGGIDSFPLYISRRRPTAPEELFFPFPVPSDVPKDSIRECP